MTAPSNAELRKAIKQILQPLAASVASKTLGIDGRRAYRLKAERELVALFQAREQQLLTELLGAKQTYMFLTHPDLEAVPVSVIERLQNKTNDGGRNGGL